MIYIMLLPPCLTTRSFMHIIILSNKKNTSLRLIRTVRVKEKNKFHSRYDRTVLSRRRIDVMVPVKIMANMNYLQISWELPLANLGVSYLFILFLLPVVWCLKKMKSSLGLLLFCGGWLCAGLMPVLNDIFVKKRSLSTERFGTFFILFLPQAIYRTTDWGSKACKMES